MKDKLQKVYEDYAEFLGFDPEKMAKAKSIKITWKYGPHKQLLSIFNHLNKNNDHIAVMALQELSTEVVELVKSMSAEDLIKNFEDLKKAVEMATETKTLYDGWMDDFYKKFLTKFSGHNLFDDDELTPENIDPMFFINLDNAMTVMKSYKYTTGKGPLKGIETAPMRLGTDILIMEDVQQFFGYLHNQDQADGIAYVHFILKVEERVDLSHFLVAITYNGHSIISTDAPSFGTPQNKNSTRNPRRHMEAKYEALGFPYGIIDELDEIRAKSTSVVVFGSHNLELHKYDIKGLPAFNKMFMIGVGDLLKREASKITDTCMLLSDFVQTKLIGDGIDLTEVDDDLFVGHNDKHKAQLAEVLGSIKEERGLIKVGADLVVNSKDYDKNWLATAPDLEKLSKWMTLNQERIRIEAALAKKFDRKDVKDAAVKALNDKMNVPENLDRLWKYIYAGDKVLFEVVDKTPPKDTFDQDLEVESTMIDFISDNKEMAGWMTHIHLGFDLDKMNERWNESDGKRIRSYDDYVWRDTCKCCGKIRNNKRKYLRIRHWRQILWLIGKNNKKFIPEYFRAYRSNDFQAYYGNPILQEVHPLSQIKHPSWQKFDNGISGAIYICKKCENNMKKEHYKAEKVCITQDGGIKVLGENDETVEYYYI